MLYPLLWMIASSFKPDELIFSQPDRAADLARPLELHRGLDTRSRVSFTTFYLNSFLIAGLAVIGNLAACSLTAFAFARLDFRFKKLLVRADARHADAALPRHAGAAVRDVPARSAG